MPVTERILVVGTGHAAVQFVASVRQGGYEGELAIVGKEDQLPYQRPPLSKGYLAGDLPVERLPLRPEAFYAANAIELHLGVGVAAIDRQARQVRLVDGTTIGYTKLVLATGTRVRNLRLAGDAWRDALSLRTLHDAHVLRDATAEARDIVIVGGGFIGLEVAATLRKADKGVTVLESQDQLMPRAISAPVSAFFREVHEARGVGIVTGAIVSSAERLPDGRIRLACANGDGFTADTMLAAIGVEPETSLAETAGLDCRDGILVDEHMLSSDPSILAIGDCTRFVNCDTGERMRLESVQNAVGQARVAAATVLGRPTPYAEVPWFWTEQYEFRLQMAGISSGYDESVLRGDPATGRFSYFYRLRGKLIAADTLNTPAEHMLTRRLLAAGVSPSSGQLADSTFSLASVLSP